MKRLIKSCISSLKKKPKGMSVLLVGAGKVMQDFKLAISKSRQTRFQIHYFEWKASCDRDSDAEKIALRNLLSKNNINKIVVAMDNDRTSLPVDLLLRLRVEGIQVVEAASFYEEVFGEIWVESVQPSDVVFGGGLSRMMVISFGKRVLDLLSASLGLIFSAPLFILLPILIKYDSEGPVFYRQERIGKKGQAFNILKFRSMRQDAELATGAVWATEDDPRVTRLGKVLRKLRLDELPQLINVLRGEMSFVGPRPERQVFIDTLEKKVPFYALRHAVKPGLTGWAQVRYPYGASEEDALAKHHYDLYYVKHLSLLFDMSIIFATIRVVLMGKGAR